MRGARRCQVWGGVRAAMGGRVGVRAALHHSYVRHYHLVHHTRHPRPPAGGKYKNTDVSPSLTGGRGWPANTK